MMYMWAYHYVTRRTAVIIQGIVQKIMEERYGVKATVPTGETDCNGRKLGPNQTTHEFFILDKRNEVKQAQLKWNTSGNYWWRWKNVKHAMMFLPRPVHTFGSVRLRTRWQVWRFDAGKHKTPWRRSSSVWSMQSI